MERMITFFVLYFCSSMVLAAASHRELKYKQIFRKIEELRTIVKDKDVELLHTPENPTEGCLDTAVTCFKNGTLKLQAVNSQLNDKFAKNVRIISKFTFRGPGKQCELSCESYKKKTPEEFLKSFAKLIQNV
ncbi:IL21 protein, partial [Formicarius rufipectus]|nr:IL21 protein [Formicarius rufipectus]